MAVEITYEIITDSSADLDTVFLEKYLAVTVGLMVFSNIAVIAVVGFLISVGVAALRNFISGAIITAVQVT